MPERMTTDDNEEIRWLAELFTAELRFQIGDANLAEVRRRNATPEYATPEHAPACASHDFCDANETMARAFRRHMGREPELIAEPAPDLDLWNRSWTLARESGFAVPAAAEPEDEHQFLRSVAGMMTWRAALHALADGVDEESGLTLAESGAAIWKNVKTLKGDSEQLAAVIEQARALLARPGRVWALVLDCRGGAEGDELYLCDSAEAASQLADRLMDQWVEGEIENGDDRPREEIEQDWRDDYAIRWTTWEVHREAAPDSAS